METLLFFSCLFFILFVLWRGSEKKAKTKKETTYDNSHIVALSRKTRKPINRTTRKPINVPSASDKFADSFRLRKGKITEDEYREKWG